MIENVLFDLDGTLTDSAPGIVSCLGHALAAVGIAPLDPATLRGFVGPPMRATLRDKLHLDEATATAVMISYRERFLDSGIYDNALFPGVATLLDTLATRGLRLAVATSKPTPLAERILEHFNIEQCFSAVCGADLDERHADKSDIVADALAALAARSTAMPRAIMVGDREQDVFGARANGLDCLGVRWGYAEPGELEAAGAVAVVEDVPALGAELAAR